MSKIRLASIVSSVLALSLLLAACGPKSINHILADPSRYTNKDVKVQGQVVDSFSVAGRGAYRVDDGTGTLWIVSERGVPREGARVQAKGKIKEGFNLGGLVDLPRGLAQGIVMLESSHKAKAGN